MYEHTSFLQTTDITQQTILLREVVLFLELIFQPSAIVLISISWVSLCPSYTDITFVLFLKTKRIKTRIAKITLQRRNCKVKICDQHNIGVLDADIKKRIYCEKQNQLKKQNENKSKKTRNIYVYMVKQINFDNVCMYVCLYGSCTFNKKISFKNRQILHPFSIQQLAVMTIAIAYCNNFLN